MNTLHRYIFRQITLVALMAVGLFVFVLVAGNAMRDVISLLAEGRLGWGMFAQLLLLLVPYVIAYALPLGLLTAVLLVLGQLSAGRELTAMRMAGLSLYNIVSPVLLVALLGMVFSLFVNFYYSPIARTTYKRNMSNLLRHDPLEFIKPHTIIKDFPGFVLYVGKREGRQLRDFWIWELDEEGRVVRFVKAERGEFDYDQEADALKLTFLNAKAEWRRESDPENFLGTAQLTSTFRSFSMALPMGTLLGEDNGVRRKLSMLTLGELLSARNHARMRERSGEPGAFEERIQIQMQIQKHFAMAYAILSLTLLGIPLGIKAARTETYANLALALALAMIYYVLVILLSFTEKYPAVRPDLLIWLPNFAFQTGGLLLIRRAARR